MEFADVVLVRLADESTRAGLFDQDALAAVAATAYDQPDLDGPYTAVFDSIEPAVDLSPRLQLRGTVRHHADPQPYEVDLWVAGLPAVGPVVTALWRGAVTARYRPAGEPVTAIASRWDADDPGSAAAGDGRSTVTGGVAVTFAPPGDVTTVPRRLPVTVAVLAREAGTQVGALLRDAAAVRERLADAGVETPVEPGLNRRHAVVVAALVPASVFDDDAWPAPAGTPAAQMPAARRAAATAWLARSGIVLVPIPS